jgi:hypothetical protein
VCPRIAWDGKDVVMMVSHRHLGVFVISNIEFSASGRRGCVPGTQAAFEAAGPQAASEAAGLSEVLSGCDLSHRERCGGKPWDV